MSTKLKERSINVEKNDFNINENYNESLKVFSKYITKIFVLMLICVVSTTFAIIALLQEKRFPGVLDFFLNNGVIKKLYIFYNDNFDVFKIINSISVGLITFAEFLFLVRHKSIKEYFKENENSRAESKVINIFIAIIYLINALIFIGCVIIRICFPAILVIITYFLLCILKYFIYIIFEHSDNKGSMNNERDNR